MRNLFLTMIVASLLGGCAVRDGRLAYEWAQQYIKQGDAPQALACFREAADQAVADSLRAAVYDEMGSLLFDEGLQEQALTSYQKAYDARQAMDDTAGMAQSCFDMANVYRTREEDDSCLFFFQRALTLAEQQGDSALTMDIHGQMAGYYLWHKDYEKAATFLLPLLSKEPSGGLFFMAADLYRQTGPADSARHYCRLLLQEEETGLRQMGHKWMADLLLAEGHTAEAAKHLEQYEQLTDSLMEETDTEALRRVSALYDYSQREQENARLERRLITAVAVVIVLLLLLLAAMLFHSRRRIKYRMKVQQLEHLLADFRRDEAKATGRQRQILEGTPIAHHIRRLLDDPRQQSMSAEDWHILEDTFEKTQPQFLSHLEEFHRFSTQEWHICLLLRLGLQPAAIAQLTARSKQSITSARSRLFEKVFGQKGSPSQWDEFVLSL